MSEKQAALASISDLLDQIGATREKSAEAHTEAGGYQGSTTHPVKDVEDRCDTASEGSRSSENSSDIKEDLGKPAVDNTSEGTPGGQDSVQMNIGVNQSATGEDASVETSSAKG